jgi:chaperonin cofactor prefoldin
MSKHSSPSAASKLAIPVELIEHRIYFVRGQKVMLDSDLAQLYQVLTKNLNKAISRNRERFPEDFMFQLTKAETEALRFQIGTSNVGRGGRRYLPYAFTQEGVAMLSSVLNSSRAIHVNIVIMRAFVKLREIMFTHKDLAHKIEALERKYAQHDEEIQVIFKTIKKLLAPPKSPKLRIGFNPNPK